MNKRLFLDLGKYGLAVVLLGWVVYSNWAPPPTKAVAAFGASSVGLCAGPAAPLVAATAAVPSRIESKGLGYVWQHHVVERHPVHYGYLVAAFVLSLASLLITLLRWHLLVRALDLTLSVADAVRYGFVGIFFNTFLPGAVGGDIVKAAALARTQNRRTAAVATVIMDRVLALWALVWFVALLGTAFWVGGFLAGPTMVTATSITCLALAVVGVSYAVWFAMGYCGEDASERFANWLTRFSLVGPTAAEFWRAVWMYRQKQEAVWYVMLLTWVGQAGFVVAFWCCAKALASPELGPMPSLTQHFLLVPLGLTMQALVPTPGGAGAGEWGFAALYLLFGAAEANGVLASLVQRVLSWVIGLGGYVVYLCTKDAPAVAEEPEVLPLPAAGSASALAG